MRQLYSPRAPIVSEYLEVGSGHEIYVEQCGDPRGIPVVFLHGGPGSGCKTDHRQFFDPKKYNIILIDQRGAGRSRPYGAVEDNNTFALFSDLETVRERFDVEAWVLFGGSWGACLALAYAEQFPSRVLAMVLRGTFLARQCDVEWFFSNGANRFLPREWEAFVERIGPADTSSMVDVLYAGIFSKDRGIVERTARAWEAWSSAVVMFSIDSSPDNYNGDLKVAIAKTRIEMHYAKHRYFLDENQLLDGLDRLPDVPITLVHGMRDLTCTADAAWAVHTGIPDSTLEIVRAAGHLSSEKAMTDALVRAADEVAQLLRGG